MIATFLTLSLFSIHVSPYFLMEQNIFEHNRVDTIYYKDADDYHTDSGYVVPELGDIVAAGVTLKEKHLWTTLSLGLPCFRYSIKFLPFFDINTGARWNNFTSYVGYHMPLKNEKDVDEMLGNVFINEINGFRSIYAGVNSYFTIKKFKIGLDLQLRREYGSYSIFSVQGYYGYRSIYRRNINTDYVQTVFTTNIGYMFKGYSPFLFISFNKRGNSEPFSFRTGIGIVLGTPPVSPCKYEGITMCSYHYYESAYPRKPNIYLYPEEPCSIKVMLNLDGRLLVSDPPYKNGWSVFVFPDGTIQNTQGYLFYEAKIDRMRVKEKGWCINQREVSSFFHSVLSSYGFNDKEIEDFVSYWKDNLPDSPFYIIYPAVNEEIDKVCAIKIYPKPDGILRVWFVIESVEDPTSIKAPSITMFKRNGFVVTEWGVILE